MLAAVEAEAATADVLIMAAAVADYAPTTSGSQKLKKEDGELLLRLERTTDILDTVRNVPIRVGFAAESEDLLANAKQKLESKELDLIVANDISCSDSGFGADQNRCTILDASGGQEALPLMPKREVADRVLDRVVELLAGAGNEAP